MAVVAARAVLFGYLFLAGASGSVIATSQAFTAGAALITLASTMMPEAYEEGGAVVRVVITAGSLKDFVLSRLQ